MDSKVEQLLWQANFLADKFEKGSETRYIDEAIVLDRQALDLCHPDHPMRSDCLVQIASHIHTCYEQLGGTDIIDEMIALGREALALRPPGHRGHSVSLYNLAMFLGDRYNEFGGMDDLNGAIALDQAVLALCPPNGPNRAGPLVCLAVDLWTRYEQLGGVKDLNKAIDLSRDAVAISPPGHPVREHALNNLAMILSSRYKQLGSVEDLQEAIDLGRDGLALRPPGHLLRSMSLNNLADHLWVRYKRLGSVEDLNEAIDLNRNSLVLRPPGHPLRSMSLNNLADNLWGRYNQLGSMEDLNEAIELDRNALALRPPGHINRSMSLNNLAIRLSSRYKRLGNVEDLSDAIDLDRNALVLRPRGHPDWSSFLENLSINIRTRYNQQRDPEDRDEIFRLYTELAHGTQTVPSSDLKAAKAWINAAEDFHHPTTLLAYETALRLLVHHVTSLPSLPQHLALHLSSSLAVDAFSACLRNQSPMKAVELLEQGRGIFWSQLTRLRSPLEDVIRSGPKGRTLADQFTHVTSFIRHALALPGADQHDRVCRLNVELEQVVSSIRELPGLSRFLLPSLFSDLQCAAIGGPIIIVNASQYSCDALVVLADKDPVHIPLSVTRGEVREMSSKLRTYTVRGKKLDVTRELGIFLRELWDRVVSPIVHFLRTTCPLQSRIWWCPTAEFSLLPLHAAGPYRKGEQNLSSLFISSYAPTLTALVHARRPSPPNSNAVIQKHFVAIGQANAVGTSKLVSVGAELTDIGQCIGSLARFTRIEGQDACISRVTDELSKNEWVHLACHGLPNPKEPFESAFALHDGHFTIQHIIQCDVKNPEFAYLSACHTTVGYEESPDEVIHLASAMQFAGFRSVIGTMWAVDDAETNKIRSGFYKWMMDGTDRLDHTRAAFALRRTMRSVDVPLDQKILYVHIGA